MLMNSDRIFLHRTDVYRIKNERNEETLYNTGLFCLLAIVACSDNDPVVEVNNGNQTEERVAASAY